MMTMLALPKSDPPGDVQGSRALQPQAAGYNPVSERLQLCASAVGKLTATIEVATKRWEVHRVLEHENISRHLQETADAIHGLKEPVTGPELPSAPVQLFDRHPATRTPISTASPGPTSAVHGLSRSNALDRYSWALTPTSQAKADTDYFDSQPQAHTDLGNDDGLATNDALFEEVENAVRGSYGSVSADSPSVSASQRGAVDNSDHALQDYGLQLMLLEQQKRKRLLMARQEQQSMMPTEHLYNLPQSAVVSAARDSSPDSTSVNDMDLQLSGPTERRAELQSDQTITKEDYERRQDSYASSHDSTSRILAHTQIVTNSHRPTKTRSKPRYDSYTGRPRRPLLNDASQATAGSTSNLPNRSRPTFTRHDLVKPAELQHPYSDYPATLASLQRQNSESATQERLHSAGDEGKAAAETCNDLHADVAYHNLVRKTPSALTQVLDESPQYRHAPSSQSPESAAKVSAQAALMPPPPRPRSGSKSRARPLSTIASYSAAPARPGPPPSTSAYNSYDHLPTFKADYQAQQYHDSTSPVQVPSYPHPFVSHSPAPTDATLYPGWSGYPQYTSRFSARQTSRMNIAPDTFGRKPPRMTRTVSARRPSIHRASHREAAHTGSTESESESTEDDAESECEDRTCRPRRRSHHDARLKERSIVASQSQRAAVNSRGESHSQEPLRRSPRSDTSLEHRASADMNESDQTAGAVAGRNDRRSTMSATSRRRQSVSTTDSSGRTKITSLSSATDHSQTVVETQSGRHTTYLSKHGQANLSRSRQKLNDQLEQQRMREEKVIALQRELSSGEPFEFTADNIKPRKHRMNSTLVTSRVNPSDGVLIKSGDTTIHVDGDLNVEELHLDVGGEDDDKGEDGYKDEEDDEDFAEVDSLLRRWTKLPLSA